MNTQPTYRLDAFEGPLDLLLYLISKHRLNIYDIEISVLLEQYLEYMDAATENGETDFEYAGEFLEMAARLIYIKTVSLLPKPEDAEELKKELQGRLIEYSACKQAAQRLQRLYIGSESFVRQPMKIPVDKTYAVIHDPKVLREAYLGMSAKARRAEPLKASVFEPIVSHRIVSVTSKIIYILKNLYTAGSCNMDSLYDGVSDKSERVATFLAVLELTKSGRIRISDDNSKIFFTAARRVRRHRASGNDDSETDDGQAPGEEPVTDEKHEGAVTKVNLWNNPAVIRHYTIAQGALRKANYWGYVKKGKNLCR